LFCLATNQIAQTGLSSLPPVIYYSEQLFRWISSHRSKRIHSLPKPANHPWVHSTIQRWRPNRSLLSPRLAMRDLIPRRIR